MLPVEMFKRLLKEMSVLLKAYGFTRKGQGFYLLQEGNTGVIAFQRSRWSRREHISFTVNIAITSTRLQEFFAVENGGV